MPEKVCSRNDTATNEKSEVDLFADDSTAHEVGNTVDEALTKLQGTAKELFDNSYKNSLTIIHPDKCKIIIISRDCFVGPIKQVTINLKMSWANY